MTTTGAEQAAFSVLAFLAESSVRAIALALVAGLAIVALRGRRAAAQLWIWTMVLYAAMAIPIVTRMVPGVGVPLPAFALSGFGGQALVPPATADGGPTAWSQGPAVVKSSSVSSLGATALDPITIAFGIYLIGVAVLLLRAGVGWTMTRRLEGAVEPVDDGEMLERLLRHAAAAGVKRLPRLTQSSQLLVPVTTSVRQPMIVLPINWREWSTVKTDAVLAHEMAHIARHDTLTQRLSLIYRAACWPNPFSWWLHGRIAELAEQASDEAALGAGIDRTTYAETLVGFFAAHQRDAGRRAVWHVAMARGASAEKRVERVLAWEAGRPLQLTRATVIAVVFAAAPVMVLASAVRPEVVTPLELPAPPGVLRPVPVNDPRPLAVPQQATVYRPGNGLTNPRPIKTADPKYTEEARLAKIQGEVDLDVVVLADGTVGDVRVTKSLDAGLDVQATVAAKQWLFKPATKDGTPVAMIVGLAIEFKLHGAPPVVQGVVPPKAIRHVEPKYTSEAMKAKITGDVDLEIVVQTNGTVGDVRVTRSLDPGLDQEAIAAARQWRFEPATKDGQPVEFVATLSIEFRIHSGPPTPTLAWADAKTPDTPGLVEPTAIKRVDPKYTSDALRAKLQGTVELEAIVLGDGSVGEVRVTKSLDSQLGLDKEAIAAVKQFTFTPATLNGYIVPAIVKLTVEFRIH